MNLKNVLPLPISKLIAGDGIEPWDPPNIIATRLVRCVQCDLFYDLIKIDEHLKTHLMSFQRDSSRRVLSSFRSSSMDKLKRLDPVSIADTNNAPIDIKTMKPEEMPTIEEIKRNISKPATNSFVNADK